MKTPFQIRSPITKLVSSIVGVLLSANASSVPLLDDASTEVVGKKPHFVTIADLNRDGRPDVVVSAAESNSVSVLLGHGDGSFQTKVDYPTGLHPKAVSTGDLNDDGALDLVVANQWSKTITVLLGTGLGTFRPLVNYPTAALGTHGIDLGDLNGDGKLDVVATGSGANLLTVRFGHGDGTFGRETVYAAGITPFSVIIKDFNHDGHNDVATANTGSRTIGIFLNDGTGNLANQVTYPTGGAGGQPRSVRAADLDGDGDIDLAAALGSSMVSVLLGNGNGTFQAARRYPTGNKPFALTISDINGDGKLDITTSNNYGNYPKLIHIGGDDVSILLGKGDGTFLPPQTDWKVGQGAFYLGSGDLNCDGAPDIVVPNYWDNTISVLLNSTGSQVTCDFTNSVP
jgi:hypothetical protein